MKNRSQITYLERFNLY